MAKKKEKIHYKELTEVELEKDLNVAKQNLFKLRFRASTSPLKNPMEIRQLRREIARLMTFLNMSAASRPASSLKTDGTAPKSLMGRNGPVNDSNFRNGRAKA